MNEKEASLENQTCFILEMLVTISYDGLDFVFVLLAIVVCVCVIPLCRVYFVNLSFSIIYVNRNMYIFTNPSARAGCDTIFKRSLTSLNSKLSFSHTGCHTKVEESALLFTRSWSENSWIHTFLHGISAK